MPRLLFLIISTVLISIPCHAAENTLTNIKNFPTTQSTRIPFIDTGYVLVLPSGKRTVVEQALQNGYYKTTTGEVISRQGIILEGENTGQSVKIDEDYAREHNIDLTAAVERPEKDAPVPPTEPSGSVANEPSRIELPTTPVEPETPTISDPVVQQTPAIKVAPEKQTSAEPDHLTIAELLPTTAIRPEKAPKQEQTKVDQPKPDHEKPKPKVEDKPKVPEKQKAKVEEKPKKPEKEKPQHKVKVGEEMRIPPEAITTGNLDFLEGCWQGTRPEYFSKRTIKECFCFGASGKNGKRRIFDRTYNRQCIGATKATLGKNGVLSVTSQGAACSDGERWGQAEMVCRNSGPRTPCSWVFRDANNGRQSYEIPFVRVESCGR